MLNRIDCVRLASLAVVAALAAGCPDAGDDDVSVAPPESPTPSPGAPRFDMDTSPIAFGQVTVGTSAEVSRTVSNLGTTDLMIAFSAGGTVPQGTAVFSVSGEDGGGAPGLLEPGASATVVVHFTPDGEDDYEGELIVSTNDENVAEVSVELSGTGYLPALDEDGDGVPADSDCDDLDPDVHPGALEVCDGKDNNCDGTVDESVLLTFFLDADADGYGDPSVSTDACEPPAGYVGDGSDCDDTDAATHPGAVEVCDQADNDCDGDIDEDVSTIYYQDGDGDGYGTDGVTTLACNAPEGFADAGGDCDDTDTTVHPGAVEACDSRDNDCDGDIDEEGETPFYLDEDGDGHGVPGAVLVGCNAPAGYVAVSDDCNDSDPAIHPGAPERCNGLDDDCDCPIGDTACTPEIDEGVTVIYYLDADRDTFGDDVPVEACQPPDDRYVTAGGDCNDLDPSVHPGADEVCNGLDDDCDGDVDEGVVQTTFFLDADGDGFGDAANATDACSAPEGYAENGDDCDDRDAAVHPGAEEVCNTVDDDCDGDVDEGVMTTFYEDADADGHGNDTVPRDACTMPDGFAEIGGDCDDDSAAVYPGAVEICNGVDDDCDGVTDEDGTTPFYRDVDGDGYGDPVISTEGCSAPEGYAENGDDCDDRDAAVHPGAEEVCNTVDDDCDGDVDEGVTVTYYLDADQDGYGDPDASTTACAPPGPRFGLDAGDCDDLDPAVNPDAAEVCNGADDDCDDVADEGFDADGDATSDCVDDDGDGFTEQDGDCDDLDASAYPGAEEIWGDGIDNDCDGMAVAERVIDFETWPDGTPVAAGDAIGDQFSPWGVYFRTDGTTTVSPTIRSHSGIGFDQPTSGVNVLGSDSYNSAGLVAYFDPDWYVTQVSIRDTDDDCTWKILFAFDEYGEIIDQVRSDGQCHEGGPLPTLTVAPVDENGDPLPIARVEFDTQAGPSGGSYDGTYFTIDDFTFVYGMRPEGTPRTRVVDFEFTPEGIPLAEGTPLLSQYVGWGVQFETDGTTSASPTIRSYSGTGMLRPSSGKNALGSDSNNSAGIIVRFTDDIIVTRVSLRDTDNDGTVKTLYAFDADGNVIDSDESHGTQDGRAPLPLIQVAPVDPDGNPVRIYSVEFDTEPGNAGGSLDGTVFTLDDLSFTYYLD